MQTVREQILARLSAFNPTMLEVIDDSASHAGHSGAASHAARTGITDGTHFEISIVSSAFAGKPLLARHRMIYAELEDLMKTRIHALRIDARTA